MDKKERSKLLRLIAKALAGDELMGSGDMLDAENILHEVENDYVLIERKKTVGGDNG